MERGPAREVIDAYLRRGKEASTTPLESAPTERHGRGAFHRRGVEDKSGTGSHRHERPPGDLPPRLPSADGRPVQHLVVGIYVRGNYGQPLFICISRVAQTGFPTLAPSGSVWCHIPELPLLPGVYTLDIWCKVDEALSDRVNHASELTVSEGDFFGSGKLPPREGGEFLVHHEWEVTRA